MIKTILQSSLIVMALVATQQAYAYNAVESALNEQLFKAACMAEGNLSSVTAIATLSRCPIAWQKFLNGTQLIDEARKNGKLK